MSRPTISSALPWSGGSETGLRSELVLAAGDLEPLADPFVPISDFARYARVLLARFALDSETLQYFALKIQRSVYRPLGRLRIQTRIGNPEIDALWRTEQERLRRAGGSEHVQRLYELGGSESLPVTFCKKMRCYFHPPCPQTRAPLRTCRDDQVLIEAGLRPYETSAERYLAPSPVPAEGEPATFYRYMAHPGEQPRGHAALRIGTELYRDFGKLVRAELEPPEAEELAARFPCQRCEHREDCYPQDSGPDDPIPAEKRLVPLSFYDFRFLAIEAPELTFGELCDVLGGAPGATVVARAEGASTSGRLPLLQGALATRGEPGAWLFRGDAVLFPLEVLRLKLVAFEQACRGLRSLHDACHAPYLNASADNLLASLPAVPAGVPAHWLFSVKLTNLGAVLPWREDGVDPAAAPRLTVPSPDVNELCASPFMVPSAFGEEHAVRVSVTKVVPEGERLMVRLEARVPAGSRLVEHRTGDAARLTSHGAVAGLPLVQLWADVEESTTQMLRLTAELAGEAASADWCAPLTFDASVAFYRRFGLSCDLYGLGMLLLRAVLSNDRQGLDSVGRAAQGILRRLSGTLDLRNDAVVDAEEARRALLAEVERDSEGLFAAHNLLYSKAERGAHPDPVPADLWADTLVLAFRLLSTIPGFAFCRDHADFDREPPGILAGKVLGEVHALIERIYVEMFERGQRDTDIRAVCRDVLAKLPNGLEPRSSS
ncbi:MAG: hypothetical protein AAF628_03885 [Planctomycetota bacterium]